MAHFAELDNDNIVLRVLVVGNDKLLENGIEVEQKGIDFLKTMFGENTRWVQTSYNRSFRRVFAGIGFKYDELNNIFII